jgi:4-amino-4-deoxy-L-arabinose transferase-like glycosyltransferase
LFKLLSGWYGPQASWLYPLAVVGLVAGLYLTRWARRGNPVRCGFLMWGTWLCTVGLVFSVMTTIPHTAYLAMLAPPVAALAAVGIYLLAGMYRTERDSGWPPPLEPGSSRPSCWSPRGSRTASWGGWPASR